MNFPQNLSYVKTHEWLLREGGKVKIGLSDFAQDALGDLVFINLPSIGDTVSAGEVFGDVESVKAVSDVYSPVSGTVCDVNSELEAHPELINSDPYGTWLIEVEEVTAEEELLDAEAYQRVCEEEK